MNGMREYQAWLISELEDAKEDMFQGDEYADGMAVGLQMAHDMFKKYTSEKED